MANISERIKELRLSRQMTQTEFGNVFGIVKSTISLYESGKSTPNDQIKTKICEYFNVSTDYLLGITDISSSNSPPQERTGANEEAGGNLAYWIRKTGLSYAEVAEKVGVSESLLEDYCSGCMGAAVGSAGRAGEALLRVYGLPAWLPGKEPADRIGWKHTVSV